MYRNNESKNPFRSLNQQDQEGYLERRQYRQCQNQYIRHAERAQQVSRNPFSQLIEADADNIESQQRQEGHKQQTKVGRSELQFYEPSSKLVSEKHQEQQQNLMDQVETGTTRLDFNIEEDLMNILPQDISCESEDDDSDSAGPHYQGAKRSDCLEEQARRFLEEKRLEQDGLITKKTFNQRKFEKEKPKSNKFLTRKLFDEALQSLEPAENLSTMLIKYYAADGSFKEAINNTQTSKFRDLYEVLMKCYFCLAQAQRSSYVRFIDEIFKSNLKQQLDRKIREYQDIDSLPRKQNTIIQFLEEMIQSFEQFSLVSSDLQIVPIQEIFSLCKFLSRLHPSVYSQYLIQLEQIESASLDRQQKYLEEINQENIRNEMHKNQFKMQGIEINYQTCPAGPCDLDFQSEHSAFGQLIPVLQHQPYLSTELYLNNHFYILREDYLREFRRAIASLKKTGLQQIDQQAIQNLYLYTNLTSLGAKITPIGLVFQFRVSAFDPRNRKIDWSKSERLMIGSLIILTSSTFETMCYTTIVNRSSYPYSEDCIIYVQFIGDSLYKIIESFNKLMMSKHPLIALENKIFFLPYHLFLQSIQKINTVQYPFKDQIIQSLNTSIYPKYISNEMAQQGVFYKVNLQFSLTQMNLNYFGTSVNILSENWNLNQGQTLDNSQFRAVQLMLNSGIALVQGPPGTGKTYCGGLAVKILLENQSIWNRQGANKPILIVCQTNHALDQFLEHILTFTRKEDVVRIGGRSKHEIISTLGLPKHKLDFEWKFYFFIQFIVGNQIMEIFKTKSKVCFEKFEEQWPYLADEMIDSFLQKENLYFKKDLSYSGKNFINYLWQRCQVPTQKDIKQLIAIEKSEKNYLSRKPNVELKQPFLIIADIQEDEELIVHQEHQPIQNRIQEETRLDSDDEEDRKAYTSNWWDDNGDHLNNLENIRQRFKGLLYNQERTDLINRSIQEGSLSLWELSQSDRKQLQAQVFQIQYQQKLDQYQASFEFYDHLRKEVEELYIKADIQYIQRKKIVGLTVTGCAKYAQRLKDIQYSIMVIEEAAEVLESHTAAILTKNIEHLILIGDHLQLRPKLESYFLDKKYQTNISLFERLINNQVPFVTLNTQRRMKTKFADFVRLIYKDYNDHQFVEDNKNSVQIQGIKSDLIFFNHNQSESTDAFSSSKSNLFEATMIVKMARYLNQNGLPYEKMTILTMYMKQALVIKNLAKQNQVEARIQTVDNYQGEENDVIFLSLVRSNQDHKLGFIGIENRVCVALSRARFGLYVFGNFDFIQETALVFAEQSRYTLWRRIIDLARTKEVLQDHIILECISHKNQTYIKTVNDWDNVQSGGCQEICNKRFSCGKVCKAVCHPIQHLRSNCDDECVNILPCGHRCLDKCNVEPCPKCKKTVKKERPCGHFIEMECTFPLLTLNLTHCQEKVKIIQPCGHEIYLPCQNRNIIPPCTIKVKRLLKCGHEESVNCCDQNKSDPQCTTPTYHLLNCGHEYPVSCSNKNPRIDLLFCNKIVKRTLKCGHEADALCYKQTYYQECSEIIQKQLECGHEVIIKCSSSQMPACYARCFKIYECGHNCQLLCSQDCRYINCQERIRVDLPCGHKKSIFCFQKELSLDLTCDNPCKTKLSCGHICQGSCSQCMHNLHLQCSSPCKKTLDCGEPKQHKCEQQCCVPCVCLKCERDYSYLKNSRNDYKQCLHFREQCYLPCQNLLPCDCQCLGICGEECPEFCLADYHGNSEIQQIEGFNSNPLSKYYTLECKNKHIFQVHALDLFFEQQTQQLRDKFYHLQCPSCQQVVTKSSRYKNYVELAKWNTTVTFDMIQNLRERIYLREGDIEGFLARLEQFIMKKRIQAFRRGISDLTIYQYNCILNQINCFPTTFKLNKLKFENNECQILKTLLIKQYLLNDEFYEYSNDQIWDLIFTKLQTITLYEDILNEFCQQLRTPNYTLAQLVFTIQDNHFILNKITYNNLQQQLQEASVSHQSLLFRSSYISDINKDDWKQCTRGHFVYVPKDLIDQENNQNEQSQGLIDCFQCLDQS